MDITVLLPKIVSLQKLLEEVQPNLIKFFI